MIDSVTLRLDKKYYSLLSREEFTSNRNKGGRGFQSFSYFAEDYRKKQKKKGLYFPLINIQKSSRGRGNTTEYLEIQASLPKLLHGTNLVEIDTSDKDKIYRHLYNAVKEVEISIQEEDIKHAIVARVDFGKIIQIPIHLGEADYIVRKLSSFTYKKKSKFREVQYNDAGNGASIKFINSTQGYAVYDKIGEIQKKGYTKQEKRIQQVFNENGYRKNVLKFELAIHRKDSLNSFLKKRIQKKNGYTLDDIMDYDLCKNALNEAFSDVFMGLNFGLLSLAEMEENQLLEYLSEHKITQIEREKLFYWTRLASKYGIAGMREKITLVYKGACITRRTKEIEGIIEKLGKISGDLPNLIEFLKKEHERFQIIKLKKTE